jgi:hypothetical protein
MSPSLSTIINVVLDAGIVLAILSVLVWGIVTHRRDVLGRLFTERRRGVDRRRVVQPRPVHAERRRAERRAPQAIPSM